MPGKNLRKFEKVCEILDRNGRNPARLVPILQAVQEEYRYLPEEIMTYIATALGVSPAQVFGVATFYSHFAHLRRDRLSRKKIHRPVGRAARKTGCYRS